MTKLYVPVVTLSDNDNITFLKKIKQGSKRTISWNKYRSEIITKPNNNNLVYLIDPTIRNINKLFFLSFENGRYSFDTYYISTYYIITPLVEINALINNKPFFDQPVKNKQEAFEKLIEMSRNDAIQQVDWLYYQTYYKLIGKDIYQDKHIREFLNKLTLQESQKKMTVPQCFLLLKSSKKLFYFFLDSLIVTE